MAVVLRTKKLREDRCNDVSDILPKERLAAMGCWRRYMRPLSYGWVTESSVVYFQRQ